LRPAAAARRLTSTGAKLPESAAAHDHFVGGGAAGLELYLKQKKFLGFYNPVQLTHCKAVI